MARTLTPPNGAGTREDVLASAPLPSWKRRSRFSGILHSDPVPLPFGGSYAGLVAVYDQDRVMGLPDHADELGRHLLEQAEVYRVDVERIQREFVARWAEKLAPDEDGTLSSHSEEDQAAFDADSAATRTQIDEFTEKIRAIGRDLVFGILDYTLVGVGVLVSEQDPLTREKQQVLRWPYEDQPAPDPHRPETWAGWSNRVLGWLTDSGEQGALGAVRGQMKNPLSVGSSRPSSS